MYFLDTVTKKFLEHLKLANVWNKYLHSDQLGILNVPLATNGGIVDIEMLLIIPEH